MKPAGKWQRQEEQLTPREREKIHELYRVHLLEIDLICERYGMDEEAIKAVLSRPVEKRATQWRLKWDTECGTRHEECFDSFKAARTRHAALKSVEWSKIERI